MPSIARGRSVSTRFLVLYWFPREDEGREPRLGLAVPEATAARSCATGSSGSSARRGARSCDGAPPGHDYVLIAVPGWPRRRDARPRVAAERVGEVLGKAAGVRYLGIGLVYAYRYTFGLLCAGRHLQVPPELLAVRDRRAARARAPPRLGAGRLAAAALQPVEPRRRRPRAEIAHAGLILAGILTPLEDPLVGVLDHLHDERRPVVGLVDRRARRSSSGCCSCR